MTRTRQSNLARLLISLLALALLATACGSSADDAVDAAVDEVEEVATDATGDDDDGAMEEDSDDGAMEEESDDGAMEEESDDGAMEEESGDAMGGPVSGGTLTALLEAESDTWDIPGANCAVSCITVMRTVAEPLTIVNDAGEVEPFLLETYDVNDDFTEHTLTLRDGITFHDGTAADGAAMQKSLQSMAGGLLQGQVFLDLVDGPDSIELVDDMTVKVSFSRPFSTFGYNIAERTGWLIAPSYWDDPERAAALMVGTGPFEMTEWTRGEQTVVVKNEDYWRSDGDGNALPYLDEIVFRPVPDVSTRRATMEAGDADLNMDSFGENRAFWNGEWLDNGGKLLVPSEDRETTYLMFNNAAPPFDDPQVRRALSHCSDRDEYIAFRAPGNELANGPFAKGALGYIDDPGFPQFDPEEGNRIFDEIGRPDVITYGTTNVPSNLLTAELFADMWSTNCGLNVEIDQFDQSELITKAITGAFEVFLWRNHGQGNPGLEFIWWHSRHASGLALNFGRIIDEDLDADLEATWATVDEGELDALGQSINEKFASEVYNMWLNTTEWANPYQANVHGVGVVDTPSGSKAQTGIAGRTWLNQAWKDAG